MLSTAKSIARMFPLSCRAAIAAFWRFNADDGWAIASHIALTTLLALFPFLIVLGALARFLGAKEIADDVVGLMFQTWPEEVADRIGSEIHAVLTTSRGDLLTINLIFAIYFASSGVESLRIGLNRAYGTAEPRNWVILRLESIVYVLVTLAAMLALGFLIVLAPLILATTAEYAPWIARAEGWITLARYGSATLVLVTALLLVHAWLPAGRRSFKEILPGVVATLLLWLLCGVVFGRYLAQFAQTYVTYYSGLSSAMIALVFLYFTALIFVYGGELNYAIATLMDAESDQRDSAASKAPGDRKSAQPDLLSRLERTGASRQRERSESE
jgi:membrane protein